MKEGGTMITNYHTHTTRCNHAIGTEREYIEGAIKNGLKVLGFSEHAPYPFSQPEKHYTLHYMKQEQIEDFISTMTALREEYKNDIAIHIGLETEYYPAYFDKHMENLSQYPFEYLILGQHFLGNGELGPGSASPTEDPARLIEYCDLVAEGIATGRFTYLAHPDLIGFTGDPVLYEAQMRRLCKNVNDCKMPIEINFHGYFANKHYPNEAFWKIAGEEHCDVIYALDAHDPTEFEFQERLQRAEEMAARCNLHILDDIKLVKPF